MQKSLLCVFIGILFSLIVSSNVFAQVKKEQESSSATIVLPMDLDSQFIPSGWMGDGKEGKKYISFDRIPVVIRGKQHVGIHIVYTNGPNWAGIYWQYPEGNWGGSPGISLQGAKKITFLAKGATGKEILEFKSGGITGPYGDSYMSTTGKKVLTKEWKKYSINLVGHNLSNVVGAFSWNATSRDNGGKLDFYLSNILVE